MKSNKPLDVILVNGDSAREDSVTADSNKNSSFTKRKVSILLSEEGYRFLGMIAGYEAGIGVSKKKSQEVISKLFEEFIFEKVKEITYSKKQGSQST